MELTAKSVEDVVAQGRVIVDFCSISEQFSKASDASHEAMAQLEACVSMLQDLSACVESLKTVGCTDTWLDIVNKNNQFVIACNIELPKFLEGSKTRTEACLEGALDTFKMWAEKAWKVIVWIFNTIVSMARTAMELMNRKSGRTLQETVDNLRKAAKNAESAAYPKLHTTITDFEILRRYITELTELCSIIKEEVDKPDGELSLSHIANQDTAGNIFKIKTGNTRMDVTSTIISLLHRKAKQLDLDYYGYIVTREGIEFVDPNSIPKIDVNLTDDQIDQIQAVFEMARSKDFTHCQEMLSDLMRRLSIFQAKLKTYKDNATAQLKAGVVNNVTSLVEPQDFTDAIARVKTFYTILNRIVIQLYSLSVRATDEFANVTNVLKRAGK